MIAQPAPRPDRYTELESRIYNMLETGGEKQLRDGNIVEDDRPVNDRLNQMTEMVLDLYQQTTLRLYLAENGGRPLAPKEYVHVASVRNHAIDLIKKLAKDYKKSGEEARMDREDLQYLHNRFYGKGDLGNGVVQSLANMSAQRIIECEYQRLFYTKQEEKLREGLLAVDSLIDRIRA